jgi:hypothetical protein
MLDVEVDMTASLARVQSRIELESDWGRSHSSGRPDEGSNQHGRQDGDQRAEFPIDTRLCENSIKTHGEKPEGHNQNICAETPVRNPLPKYKGG